MKLYAIADLHLSLGTGKPMDVFGAHWEKHEEKIRENWEEVVTDEDVVLLPGDFSWAMYLDEAYKDFEYINKLPR